MPHNPLGFPPAIGEIKAGVVYTRAEIKRRVGWSHAAFREAMKRELNVKRNGKSHLVLGDDYPAYAAKLPDA